MTERSSSDSFITIGLVITLLGLLGNGYCLVIFMRLPLRSKTTTPFLVCSIVGNLIAIINLLIFNLTPNLYENSIPLTNSSCRLNLYLNYLASCTSSWSIVLFTFERYKAVSSPIEHFLNRTVAKSRIHAGMLFLALLVYNGCVIPLVVSHDAFHLTVNEVNGTFQLDEIVHQVCGENEHYDPLFWKIFEGIDIFFGFLVPMATVCFWNAKISHSIYNTRINTRIRKHVGNQITNTNSAPVIASTSQPPPTHPNEVGLLTIITNETAETLPLTTGQSMLTDRARTSSKRTLITLFVLSISYVLLNLPHNIIRAVQLMSHLQLFSLWILQASFLLYYSQFVINILAYSIGFVELFCWPSTTSATTVVRYNRAPSINPTASRNMTRRC